jgi:hypothetical protein
MNKNDNEAGQAVKVKRLVKWFVSGDTGKSSKAIVGVMEGVSPCDKFHGCHPSDGGDFGRCYRLLEEIPEYKTRIDEMKPVSPEWEVLVNHWNELSEMHRRKGDMYKRMKELFATCPRRPNVVELGPGVSVSFGA